MYEYEQEDDNENDRQEMEEVGREEVYSTTLLTHALSISDCRRDCVVTPCNRATTLGTEC